MTATKEKISPNEIIALVAEAYLNVAQYWDDTCSRPARISANTHGDSLAFFVAQEVYSAVSDAPDTWTALDDAIGYMTSAIEDLDRVVDALRIRRHEEFESSVRPLTEDGKND